MIRFLVGFALLLAPLRAFSQDVTLPPIALYTQFEIPPALAVLEAMKSEVQSIMAPAGLNFQWADLASADGQHAVIHLAIINFLGRCDTVGLMPRDSTPKALGWTSVSDGVVLPFAKVDCAAVRGFTQKELMELPQAVRAGTFGHALGRVLAHELYHIFASTVKHGVAGVGREVYSVHNLLCADFQFETREMAALVNGKAHADLVYAATAASSEEAERRYE
jgi:hypothetical protein